MTKLSIQMFGEFSLRSGETVISANNNRSKKVWLLLVYLLCHRGRMVTRKELIDVLWGDHSISEQPENALKIAFHRLRTQLNQLWPTAGHDLILFKDGGYSWNTKVPTELDIDRFELLSHLKTDDNEELLRSRLDALALYRGDFLNRFSSETWIIPLAAHYHNLYTQLILDTCPLLASRGLHREIISICRPALTVEPYHELMHQHLMQALLEVNDRKGAVSIYKELEKRLNTDFGLKPGKELQALYQAAAQTPGDQPLHMDTIREHLKELHTETNIGALQHDYEYFKVLCHAESRAMLRSARETHIALLSVTGGAAKPLSKRSTETAMKHLGEHIRSNLRLGDSFSRCSSSQYILMLPNANFENSGMVCRRVIGSFSRKHPHSPAVIHFIVEPLSSAEHLFRDR